MKSIGGYLGLELQYGAHYHKKAIKLNTARNCLEYIILARQYNKVYIPFFSCSALLEPLVKHHIKYEFYNIDKNFYPIIDGQIMPNEAVLYINYFVINRSNVN